MDNYLEFTGPVKLIIVEKALVENRNGKFRELEKAGITRLIFDSQSRPVSELRENSSLEYQYDDEGNLMAVRERDKKGALVEEYRMTYRENRLLIKNKLSPDSTVRESRTYRYDEENRLISESQGSRHIRYEYKDDYIHREYRYYGKEPELALVYRHNESGKPLQIETFSKEGASLRLEQFVWKDNLLSEWIIRGKDGRTFKNDRYEYSCFHEGNWLKRIRYNRIEPNRENPVEVIYRSIAYSDSCPDVKPVHEEEKVIQHQSPGALTFKDGSLYRGEIRDGKMEGKGFIQWPDGSSYKGEFRNNRMNGRGILTWPNGDIYSGMFKEGKMEGVGRLRWAGGKRFYGLFEENRRTRQGIIEED
ncbi:MAG: hypothetical protein JXR86_08070 [Spirochaetales bacterium]|nr:hypothetical protein [Spirochaetales bacterium]